MTPCILAVALAVAAATLLVFGPNAFDALLRGRARSDMLKGQNPRHALLGDERVRVLGPLEGGLLVEFRSGRRLVVRPDQLRMPRNEGDPGSSS